MTYEQIIKQLKAMGDPKNVEGMARFGIRPKSKVLGISVTALRKFAKGIEKDYVLAQKLWKSDIHEAKILSTIIDEPEKVTEKQMDSMITNFDSWDICDLACANLFDKTPFAFRKAAEWSKKDKEFEKRAGYALMACLAWHDKEAPNSKFVKFVPHIKRGATDERNFVKKSVNWAVRQIGKRNKHLNTESIKLAREIIKTYPDSKSAQWIAKDALRELTDKKVQKRLAVTSTH